MRVFTDMEVRVEVRRRVLTGELSKRAACREYEIHWQTLEKILSHSEPPGYQKTKPRSSIVDAFLPIIEEILKSDRHVHRRQRHTARRIFERLRDEHGYVGGETIVKDAVRACKQHHREVFSSLPALSNSCPLSVRKTQPQTSESVAKKFPEEPCFLRDDRLVCSPSHTGKLFVGLKRVSHLRELSFSCYRQLPLLTNDGRKVQGLIEISFPRQ
jgi:hypothetical protein